jgi:hypothetical protein
MSDYRSEQDAAAFWRKIDARIERKISDQFKVQTGIVPGVAYGSTIFDAAGRAVWGGAGGGGIIGLAAYKTSDSQSIADSDNIVVNYDTPISDDNDLVTTGASWAYTGATQGIYIVIASLAWGAINWAAGVDTRTKVFVNGSNSWNLDWQTHAQGGAGVRTLHGTGYVFLNEGDELDIRAYQSSGSSQSTISVGSISAVAIWCLAPST